MDIEGKRPRGVTAKDIILAVIGKIGIAGGTGFVFEYTGEAVRGLSMEGRMTMCNMSIEGGARAGMVAPDETTFAYLEGRPFVPRGKEFQEVVEFWKTLPTDRDAKYDETITLRSRDLAPMVTWGTNPGMVTQVSDRVPDPASFNDPVDREAASRALVYMDLKPGTAMEDIPLDHVIYRIVHEFAAGRFARGGKGGGGKTRGEIAKAGAGGAGFARGEGRSGVRRVG